MRAGGHHGGHTADQQGRESRARGVHIAPPAPGGIDPPPIPDDSGLHSYQTGDNQRNNGCANGSPGDAADHGHSHSPGKACAGDQASAHGHGHRAAAAHGHGGPAKVRKDHCAADQPKKVADHGAGGQQTRPSNPKAAKKFGAAAKLRQELLSPKNKPKEQAAQQHNDKPAVTVVDKSVVESSYEAYKMENAQARPAVNHAWSSCAVDSPPSDVDLLDALESCFFGEPHKGALAHRLTQLESAYAGKAQSGPFKPRLMSLETQMLGIIAETAGHHDVQA